MNILITSLLLVAGVGLTCAQVTRPPCPPPPSVLRNAFNRTTDPGGAKRGIRELTGVGKNNPWYEATIEGAIASKINPVDWIAKPRGWRSVCEGSPVSIRLPHWHIVKGRLCYTPKPFQDYIYPSLICPNVRCDGVNPTDRREVAFCRPQNRKTYTICIWCLNKKGTKFVRTEYDIHTYRCCSCCRFRCGIRK